MSPLDVGLHVGREVQIARGAVFDSIELGESGFEQPSEVVVGWAGLGGSLFSSSEESQQIEDGDPCRRGFSVTPSITWKFWEPVSRIAPGGEITRVHELLDGAQETRRVLDLVDGERRMELPHEQGPGPDWRVPLVVRSSRLTYA